MGYVEGNPALALEERGLRARGALGAAELQAGADVLDGFEVEKQILGPLGGALADGDELGGLEMRVGESGEGLVLHGELGEVGENFSEFREEQVHGIAHEDEFGIVGYVA
jgi:hypothetical protein